MYLKIYLTISITLYPSYVNINYWELPGMVNSKLMNKNSWFIIDFLDNIMCYVWWIQINGIPIIKPALYRSVVSKKHKSVYTWSKAGFKIVFRNLYTYPTRL